MRLGIPPDAAGEDVPKGTPRRQGRQSRRRVRSEQGVLQGDILGPPYTSRTVRQVLLNCVKPTPESIFGDQINIDVNAAINLAKDRIEWLGPRNAGGPIWEIKTEYITIHNISIRCVELTNASRKNGKATLKKMLIPIVIIAGTSTALPSDEERIATKRLIFPAKRGIAGGKRLGQVHSDPDCV